MTVWSLEATDLYINNLGFFKYYLFLIFEIRLDIKQNCAIILYSTKGVLKVAAVKKATAKATIAKKAPTKKNTKKTTTKASAKKKVTKVTEEQIRARAYEIYEERGNHHGLDVDHWIQAEKELSQN